MLAESLWIHDSAKATALTESTSAQSLWIIPFTKQ
jgi:hypothetical protein